MSVRTTSLSVAALLAATVVGGLAVAQVPPAPVASAPSTMPATPPPVVDDFSAVKGQIKASDEEWKVITPALRKVVNMRRTAEAGLVSGTPRNNMGNMRGRGFGGGGGGPPGGMGNDAFGGPAGPGGGGRGFGPGGGGPGRGDGNGSPPDQQGNRQGGRGDFNGPPGGGMPGGGGGGPGGGMFGGGGAVATAMTELKTAATAEKPEPDDVKAKLAAVRAARLKARAAVTDAVADLMALVTPEQEAVLVGLGYLE